MTDQRPLPPLPCFHSRFLPMLLQTWTFQWLPKACAIFLTCLHFHRTCVKLTLSPHALFQAKTLVTMAS